MRIRKKQWALPELMRCDFFIRDASSYKGRWNEAFKNKVNPIHMELGTGKGAFISQIACKNPCINYISVDVKDDMLGYARRKINGAYSQVNAKIDNVVLVSHNVERIDLMMSEEYDKVERIYINFCNPWPKPKHRKRRLTHTRQLEKYKKFLVSDGEIHFKTDDDELFKDSVKYLLDCGFEIVFKTYDLNAENIKDNIVTEHEQMFMNEGIAIKFLIAKRI